MRQGLYGYMCILTIIEVSVLVGVLESTYKVGVLVCYDCHNKIPQLASLNNRNLFSHSFGGFEVQNQGAGSGEFLRPTDGHPLAASSQGHFYTHMHPCVSSSS